MKHLVLSQRQGKLNKQERKNNLEEAGAVETTVAASPLFVYPYRRSLSIDDPSLKDEVQI